MKKTFRSMLLVSGLWFGLASVSACSPIVATRGNLITAAQFDQVRANSSTRADVTRFWGPPTTSSPFDSNTWYYIGETTSQKGIFAAKVDKRRMIRVKFDPNNNDTVIDISEIDPKLAKNVDPVSRTTPTAGKDFTLLQQFVGNLGKYNTNPAKK